MCVYVYVLVFGAVSHLSIDRRNMRGDKMEVKFIC